MSLTTHAPISLQDLATGAFDAKQLGFGVEEYAAVVQRMAEEDAYETVADWRLSLGCVDCRRQYSGACVAGGIMTAVVGYIAANGSSAGSNILQVITELHNRGIVPIVHKECGALRNFMLVVSRIASGQGIEFDAICSALVALGLEPSLIFDVSRRFAVVPEDFMVSEQELFDHILGLGGRVEEFELKDHTEVATLVNSAANQTFRRSALPLRQGQPRAFTLDAWTVPEIASAVAPQQNISLSTLAMFAYNCGVLLLLAGPDHKVVIRAS